MSEIVGYTGGIGLALGHNRWYVAAPCILLLVIEAGVLALFQWRARLVGRYFRSRRVTPKTNNA